MDGRFPSGALPRFLCLFACFFLAATGVVVGVGDYDRANAVKGTQFELVFHGSMNIQELLDRLALEPEELGEAIPRSHNPPIEKPRNPPVPPEILEEALRLTLESADARAESDKLRRPASPEVSIPSYSPEPETSFVALQTNFNSFPPDTHGAVGPDKLTTMLNTQVRFQSRTGQNLGTMGLRSFWSRAGLQSPFDPRVLYDPYEDRWMAVVAKDAGASTAGIAVAVSQTSDPQGTWNYYSVTVGSQGVWVDFPTLGFNKNWIVVQGNVIANSGFFDSSRVWAFDKATLYAGGANTFTELNLGRTNGITQQPAVHYDPAIDTFYLLQEWNGNSGGQGFLRIWEITGPVGGETITGGPFATFNQTWSGQQPMINNGFAQQLGTQTRINNNATDMGNAVYRNGWLWGTHNAFLPTAGPNHTAVQWWQVNPTNGVVQQVGRIEETNPMTWYAFPSIAVNAQDAVLIGYSVFTADTYAAAAYSTRNASTPSGEMEDPYIYKDGQNIWVGIDGAGRNRWGDYSNTVIDPLNDQDFWTLQEWGGMPSGAQGWTTSWAHVVSAPEEICDDGIDNNNDGDTDCDDVLCQDQDGDGNAPIPCGPDCDESDTDVWALPADPTIRFTNRDEMVWDDLTTQAGPTVFYQVLLGSVATGLPVGSALEICPGRNVTENRYDVPSIIPLAQPYWFLVRGSNECTDPSYPFGADSSGNDRVSTVCP